MRTLSTRRISIIAPLIALLAVAAAGCSSATGPSEPTWTLDVPLTGLLVVGDCEAAPGNPGEFAWRIEIGNGTAALMDRRETGGFPSSGGAWELSEEQYEYATPYSLRLTDISSEARSGISIAVTATEWDGAERDGNMTFERASEPIRTGVAGTGAIQVGPSSACRLIFRYEWRWTQG